MSYRAINLTELRRYFTAMRPSNTGGVYIHKRQASLLWQKPTALIGLGATSACFHVSRIQAENLAQWITHLRLSRTAPLHEVLQADDFVERIRRLSKKWEPPRTYRSSWNRDANFVLKVLCPKPEISRTRREHDDILSRFQREARIGTRLPPHPNVVRIYALAPLWIQIDTWVCANTWGMLQEHCGSRSLASVIEDRRISFVKRIQYACELSRAIQHLHRNRIVHRDVKPTNILVSSEKLKLADLGVLKPLASLAEGSDIHTSTGQKGLGTFLYMAPEQIADSKRIDRKADIFGLTITILQLLLGRTFASRDEVLELAGLTRRRFLKPTSFVAYLPEAISYPGSETLKTDSVEKTILGGILQKGMAWKSERRPSAREFSKRFDEMSGTTRKCS